jgi:hypothetical protein
MGPPVKSKLLGTSKRGKKHLRRMIIHGARSCVTISTEVGIGGSTASRVACTSTRSL